MVHWSSTSIFYHIYPLGLCGAPPRNDFTSAPVDRLQGLLPWLDHCRALGCNALYIGPLFESGSHGYDTADYYHPDRRLGDREALRRFCAAAHVRGLRVVLDGVFNHVGREFWAFRDVKANLQHSAYTGWFSGLRFDRRNRSGDPFSYDTWAGHESLVKLNLANPAVRQHLFGAVEHWICDYDIDGLRLDAADVIDMDFLQALRAFCLKLKPDFWLMGEVVHGDYRRWVNSQTLHSVTNYECYKGLYSSLNDHNFFEIAYALDRQFGAAGIYRDLPLYNFVDNHDVSRVASLLRDPRHLPLVYVLLFTMPGAPSLYYGSEFGITGMKDRFSDAPLRPALRLERFSPQPPPLVDHIRLLARLRRDLPALRHGGYQQAHVSGEQLAFVRQDSTQRLLIAVNAASQAVTLALAAPEGGSLTNVLCPAERVEGQNGKLSLPLAAYEWKITISGS